METDNRREHRKGLDEINLPFLGSKEADNICFQYLLLEVSPNGARIAIPKWVVNREFIKNGDIINFHLPFEVGGRYHNQGKIVWSKWDDNSQSELCGVYVENKNQPLYTGEPLYPPEKCVVKLLKDSMLLKKGVHIYLGHLIPYFSRITRYSQKDYPQLKAIFLEDVRARVMEHYLNIQGLYESAKKEICAASDIAKFIDLEELRTNIESEIYVEVFNIAFSDENIKPYLNAIKKLENRLYFNYNMIVIFYINSLK